MNKQGFSDRNKCRRCGQLHEYLIAIAVPDGYHHVCEPCLEREEREAIAKARKKYQERAEP
jgi:hypothetical protein